MTRQEILLAYKEGKYTTEEVQRLLSSLKRESRKVPLSEGQKGLWMLHKLSPQMSAYHVPLCFRIQGQLDADCFQEACRSVVNHYPALKRVIREEEGIPYQVVQEQAVQIQQENVPHLSDGGMMDYLRALKNKPLSLEEGPLLRIHVLTRSAGDHWVLVIVHHMIFDGTSSVLFMNSLLSAYESIRHGRKPELPAQEADYADFVAWEQQELSSERGNRHRDYWVRQMEGPLPVLQLPSAFSRPPEATFNGHVLTRQLPQQLGMRLKDLSSSLGVNASALLLAMFNILLHRYSGQRDLIVGMPTMGRYEERFMSLIGYFINMIPVRSQLAKGVSFTNYVKELQRTLLDGLEHAAYPFTALVRDLNLPRTQAYSPVYQVVFSYQNFVRLPGANAHDIQLVNDLHQEGEYEFGLEVFEGLDGYRLHMKYNPDIYDEGSIQRMMSHYVQLAEEIAANPGQTLEEYSLLSAAELERMLNEWNGTETELESEACVHERFSLQAQLAPEAIAAASSGKEITYRELDERSRSLAVYLQQLGITAGSRVGIYMERSVDMMIGLLGILKAGGAYIPLDPAYPAERLAYMVEDSGIAFVVTQASLQPGFQRLGTATVRPILLDADWPAIEAAAREHKLRKDVQGEQLAYMIYTSGSTGKPKGVMISHRSLMNLLLDMGRRHAIKQGDSMFSMAPYGFDMVIPELYLPLITGATCYLCDLETVKDPEKLKQEIRSVRPALMQATPTVCTMLFQSGWENEEQVVILCGAEPLSPALQQQFDELGCEVWNMYGPTETTVWSMAKRLVPGQKLTIGKPLSNTRVYIVDSNLMPVPVSVPGELCIAGAGVAQGYWNKSELTAEKFIADPFQPGGRLYRTGDLARWLPSGEIEYLGRTDFEVKIRGFRIDLGEIEAKLLQLQAVSEAVAVVKEHEGHKQIIAYYTMAAGVPVHHMEETKLREHLSLHLPTHMLPSHLIPLEKLPLTPNGKVDRQQLMNRDIELSAERKGTHVVQPSHVQQQVLSIWEEALGVKGIGLDDGFFDIGGDSVLAVTVSQRIKSRLRCDFEVTQLFKYATVRAISQAIAKPAPVAEKAAVQETSAASVRENSSTPSANQPAYYKDSLAIIGISCRFPGASDHMAFWDNLREGKESIRFFSPEELAEAGVSEEIIRSGHYVPVQSAIEGRDRFDWEFFDLSPKDAKLMDPQFRLLLQHAWQAIEDAGYAPRSIPDTSVFMSASNSFYQAGLAGGSGSGVIENPEEYVSWVMAQGGTIPSMISYKLGMKGPSFYVHSNCSSSLTALYSAWLALRAGESKYALVGAATVFPEARVGYVHQQGLNFSSDGHIRAFDDGADGMIAGEGAGVMLLKRAEDAIADGDPIYALIRGIGMNNDGTDKVGFYAPSVQGQAEVIRKVLNATGIHPESIQYIEAHGTGTSLGDPIEFAALDEAFRDYTDKKNFCGIGSVKTNIGHADTAAGLAGCIKLAMSLRHGEVPGTLNYTRPSRHIALDASPFFVASEGYPLKKSAEPARAGLSSLGIGGTNVHALFEQYPIEAQLERERHDSGVPFIVPLSARNPERLLAYAGALLEFIRNERNQGIRLADLAYTLQVGREAMESRAAFVVQSREELVDQLTRYVAAGDSQAASNGEAKQSGSAEQLYFQDPDFQEIVDKWLTKGELYKAAEMWVKGVNLSWELLYSGSKPVRVHLPTYPFAARPVAALASRSLGGADRLPPQRTEQREVAAAEAPSSMPAHAVPSTNLVEDAKASSMLGLEQTIVQLWKEVLETEQVGMQDSFQRLGGDSIKITQIISRIKGLFPMELQLNELFQAGTVLEMAAIVEREIIERITELPDEEVAKLNLLI